MDIWVALCFFPRRQVPHGRPGKESKFVVVVQSVAQARMNLPLYKNLGRHSVRAKRPIITTDG